MRYALLLCLLPLLLAGRAEAADDAGDSGLVRLVETLHEAFPFSRLGFLTREGNGSPYLKAANIAAARGGFAVVAQDMPAGAPDPEQCRDAVDALFFEGVDAIALDDSLCFSPGSEAFADLMQGLVQQGVAALSLHTEDHVRAGALAGPAGRAASLPVKAAPARASARPGKERLLVLRPLVVNGDTAKALGIDLSVAALLAADAVYGAALPQGTPPEH